MVSAITSMQQAQLAQQATLKATKLTMDAQESQGAQITQMIADANKNCAGCSAGGVDMYA